MATGRASKKAKRLQNMHDYLHTKVEEVEKERTGDRSWGTKEHLINLKIPIASFYVFSSIL